MADDHLSLENKSDDKPHRRRTRRNRSYPVHTLEHALAVAHMIQNANSGLGFDRILLAQAMGTTPLSSGFTMKLISSSRYGLTTGGYNDENIALTDLGDAIVAPKNPGDTVSAIKQAVTNPTLFGDFYRKFEGRRLPEDKYVKGILHKEFRVPADLTSECWDLISANGRYAKILVPENDHIVVRLEPTTLTRYPALNISENKHCQSEKPKNPISKQPIGPFPESSSNRIYIGYSNDVQIAEAVHSLLNQFNMPYLTVGLNKNDGVPVPDRAITAMKKCSGAVLIMDSPIGSDICDPPSVNLMQYQIGASIALFAKRIVIIHRANMPPKPGYGSLQSIEFHTDRPYLLSMNLLRALDKAGMVQVTVKPL